MALHFDIRLGIVLFLVLTISGICLLSYSTQVSYPVQTPTTQYSQQLQPYPVTVYNENINQPVVSGNPLTYTWNTNTQPFDSIDFNIAETSEPISVEINSYNNGELNSIVYDSTSNNIGLHYVSAQIGYTYEFQIFNNNANPLSVQGTITVTKTEYSTQQVPYTTYTTTYQSETVYPDQGIGGILIVFGIIAGIVTAISFLANRNRMKF